MRITSYIGNLHTKIDFLCQITILMCPTALRARDSSLYGSDFAITRL